MTKPELIRLIKLLSALESWAYANTSNQRLPDYLVEEIDKSMQVLEQEVLK